MAGSAEKTDSNSETASIVIRPFKLSVLRSLQVCRMGSSYLNRGTATKLT